MSDYIYKDPIKDLGMRRIKVPKRVLRQAYPRQKAYHNTIVFFLFWKYEYYISVDNTRIIEQKLSKFYVPYLLWIMFPLFLLLHGLSNFNELVKEIKDIQFQKKRGCYIEHQFTKNIDSKGYYAMLDHLGIEYEKIATN